MALKKAQNIGTCELLLHYLKVIFDHIEYLETRGGIIEEPVAESAVQTLTFALDDINEHETSPLLKSSRDGVGDACFLLIQLLQTAQRREAMMETFESVRDVALQGMDVSRVAVRVVDGEYLQKVTDYTFKARALLAHPAKRLGVDSSLLRDNT